MAFTREDVEKVALFARLRLSDAEMDRCTSELARIVEYVEQLDSLDTENVEPLSHATELINALADDCDRPSMVRDEILANAPKRDDECYRVPAVLG